MKVSISEHFELVVRNQNSNVNSLIFTGDPKYIYIFYIPKSYTIDSLKQLCISNKSATENVFMKQFKYKSIFRGSGIYL